MILLDRNRIQRTIKRMAHQVLEEAKDNAIVLIGLNSRGYAVARYLKFYLDEIQGTEPLLCQLYADDEKEFAFPNTPNENQVLVIVDDVIFSGGTMFQSIRKISKLSVFNKIILTVLVDRGHRKYPLLAEIVGVHAPTKLNEHVELTLDNNDPNNVILIKK
ncbi:MAG: hypothetical protein EA391_02080 [Balneolaceae bacterium]|nr:MAG: hypothetical protein EA391_02080 [Balneolaceae bacterium]